ncbi:hypothetical protein J3R30DRAFT_3283151 [Lentinula aciculospora]|uniref:NAD(P)-binding protein n=1 Tax=Lentinula aciculospora TaxID=153920 RepID=A0A9W9AP94_9AGAR|nr:hypothetical protein J3R30DRAFT_3283151 [Lentinula aciculospora]
MSVRVLTSTDVRNITAKLSPELLQSLMEDVFVLISSSKSGTSYLPHRTSIPTENHTALFMPARISSMATTMKVVSVPYRSDDTRGLPASTLVLDKHTGAVKAIVNARSLTALRNAAGSLLSTTLVGPTSPTHIVAFGAGEQVLAHLDLHFQAFASIKSCMIVNRSINDRVSSVISKLESKHPSVSFHVLACDVLDNTAEPREKLKTYLSNADIIITATPSRLPLFSSSWVRSGTHVILIGSYTPQMKEVDTDLIMRAIPTSTQNDDAHHAILLVDSISACFTEAGEILEAGLKPDQVVEIGKLVLDNREHVQSKFHHKSKKMTDDFVGPITIFKSVGVGLQDVAIACVVVDMAEEMERSNVKNSTGVIIPNFDS